MGFVEIANVRKVFGSKGKEIVALDEASLSFNEGEFVALLGPSGCGKTTLLTIVAGLASKTSGSVKVGGREVDGPYSDYGFVFQQPSLMPWRSVLQNVLFPMEILGRNDAQAKARAEQLLHITGLHAFANSRPHELSGGMQQRVSLCRALIHKPKLLLMDEPFGALDEIVRDHLNEQLLKLWDRTNKTICFVTHSIPEAVYLSTRIVVMSPRPGRVTDIIESTLPRERPLGIRETAEFLEIAHRVREGLRAGHSYDE